MNLIKVLGGDMGGHRTYTTSYITSFPKTTKNTFKNQATFMGGEIDVPRNKPPLPPPDLPIP